MAVPNRFIRQYNSIDSGQMLGSVIAWGRITGDETYGYLRHRALEKGEDMGAKIDKWPNPLYRFVHMTDRRFATGFLQVIGQKAVEKFDLNHYIALHTIFETSALGEFLRKKDRRNFERFLSGYHQGTSNHLLWVDLYDIMIKTGRVVTPAFSPQELNGVLSACPKIKITYPF